MQRRERLIQFEAQALARLTRGLLAQRLLGCEPFGPASGVAFGVVLIAQARQRRTS